MQARINEKDFFSAGITFPVPALTRYPVPKMHGEPHKGKRGRCAGVAVPVSPAGRNIIPARMIFCFFPKNRDLSPMRQSGVPDFRELKRKKGSICRISISDLGKIYAASEETYSGFFYVRKCSRISSSDSAPAVLQTRADRPPAGMRPVLPVLPDPRTYQSPFVDFYFNKIHQLAGKTIFFAKKQNIYLEKFAV